MRNLNDFETSTKPFITNYTTIKIDNDIYNYITTYQPDTTNIIMDNVLLIQNRLTLASLLIWFLQVGDGIQDESKRIVVNDLLGVVMSVKEDYVRLD